MKKSIIISVLMILAINLIYSQQDPQYTQYMYNMHIVNPAYAGSHGTLNIGLLHRNQWVGLEGSPQTTVATINSPISEKIGVGLSVFADEIGVAKEQNLFADVSYTIQTSEYGKLAFGLKGGFTFLDALLSGLDLGDDLEDISFREDINTNFANFGAGAFYYTEKFYAGLSMPNMLNQVHFNKKGGAITEITKKMHFYLTSGYVFQLSNNVKLKPSFMMKGVRGSPLSFDINGNVLFNDKLEFGLGWRVDDSVSALMNIEVSPIVRIGYSYDHTMSNLGDFNSGSHEIILLMTISNSRAELSPRFF